MVDVSVIIVVKNPDALEQVKAACGSLGMTHMQALPTLGLLKGVIQESHLDELRQIPGVSSFEREGKVQLAPPDSPVQ